MLNFLTTRGVDLAVATIGLTVLTTGPAWAGEILPGPGAGLPAHAGSGMSAVRAMAVIARSTPQVLRNRHMDSLLSVESTNRILVSR